MWKDSETELDFLDYEYLIKTIEGIVINDNLLPASIGVYGDWGSGKSSLMNMAKKRLEDRNENIKCIVFNGWLFENYEDAKSAILGSILDEINNEENLSIKAKDIIKGLYKSVDKFKLIKNILKFGSNLFMPNGISTLIGIGIDACKSFADSDKKEVLENISSNIHNELDNTDLRNDLRDFQNNFESLLEESKINRLVIFIDELDRCRPDTILETLEAIKLFLFTGNVVFIIGADERHVSYAVKSKFKDIEGIQIDIGKEYLEKLIQYPIRIPRLNSSEVEIYISCLLMQSTLNKDVFSKVLSLIKENKNKDFENFKISSILNLFSGEEEYLSKIKDSISAASQLSSVLASGLHGNPRQCKRFLNSMDMRLQMATYKNKSLNRKVLAKIMMLEYIKPRIFNKIAEMVVNNTAAKELNDFEKGTVENISELKIWKEDDWFLKWCKIEPKISNENLSTYFYFTRTSLDEKISRISSFLSPNAKEILDNLLSKTDVKIKRAIENSKSLSISESANILEAMNSKMLADNTIDLEDLKAFLKFASLKDELINDAINYLQSFSGSQIPLGCSAYIANFAKENNKKSEILEIVNIWIKENKNLKSIKNLIK